MPSRQRRRSNRSPVRLSAPRKRHSFRPLLEALELRLVPSTYTVNSTGDAGTGSNFSGDLRYCITQADADAGSTIQFGSLFNTLQTITLNGNELPVLTANMTITGPAGGVIISGNLTTRSRVFEIGDGSHNPNVSMGNLTITNGQVSVNSGGLAAQGGGLLDHSTGTLALSNCTVSNNTAAASGQNINIHSASGGGLYVNGAATLSNCTISNNNAAAAEGGSSGSASGGGLYVNGPAVLSNCTVSINNASASGNTGGNSASGGGLLFNGAAALSNCTVSNNAASAFNGSVPSANDNADSGGLYVNGPAVLSNCTVSNNTAYTAAPSGFHRTASASGGGLHVSDSATLTNCTVSNNTAVANNGSSPAAFGAGLYNSGTATLTNCTVSNNTASASGGSNSNFASGVGLYNSGTATLNNTIVAGNSANGAENDINGVSVNGDYDLTGDGSAPGGHSLVNVADPGLAPLGYYGGPTPTMALLPNSPALTTGNPAAAGLPATDQRGFARVVAGKVDVGAFETQAAPFVVTTAADPGQLPGQLSLREAINLANTVGGNPTITFDTTGVFATAQTITLFGTELPKILLNEAIQGPAVGLTVSGNHQSRVFEIGDGSYNPNVTISGLTITQGRVSDNGGGLLDHSTGTLALSNCTVSNNFVAAAGRGNAASGGGLYVSGSAALSNCTVSNNTAAAIGGDDAQEAAAGGGLYVSGSATLSNCTVSNNAAGAFGGNSSGNTASGGGLYVSGSATLSNCTVSNNFVAAAGDFRSNNTAAGGGLYNGGTATLVNALVADNTAGAGPDVYLASGAVTAAYSLIGDSTASGLTATAANHNQMGTSASPLNALLAPLDNYGGTTQTMALLPGSSAIDAGISAGASLTDQRGDGRVGAVDIGAFESQGFTLKVTAGDNQLALPDTALPTNLAVQVTAKNALEPVQGGLVTFSAPASGPGGAFLGPGLTATAMIGSGGIATVPPFTTNGIFGAFTVGAAARGGNAVVFHEAVTFAAVVGGNLLVQGTSGNDSIVVTYAGGSFSVYVNGLTLPFTAGSGAGQVSPAGRVILYGLDGNDNLTVNGSIPAEIHAGNGKTVVHGGDGGSVVYGGSSASARLTAYAGAGTDVLSGGAGTATLYGGRGRSLLIGGSGTGYSYAMLTALAAKWAAGTVTASDEAALKAAITAGVADTLYAGTGATWGLATAASFMGGWASPHKKTLL